MKKKLSVMLFVMVAFCATELYAGTLEPNISLVQKGVKTYVMKLGSAATDLSISIKDKEGLVLYSDMAHSGSNYQKTYDFSQLPNGQYTIEVENEFVIKSAAIDVLASRIIVADENITIHKPIVKINGDFLDLNFLNLKEKNVEFQLYDSSGRMVFSQDLNKDVLVSKRYNISQLPRDSYSVVIYNNDRMLTKKILL